MMRLPECARCGGSTHRQHNELKCISCGHVDGWIPTKQIKSNFPRSKPVSDKTTYGVMDTAWEAACLMNEGRDVREVAQVMGTDEQRVRRALRMAREHGFADARREAG